MKYLKDAGNVLVTFVKPLRDGGENRSLGVANLQGFVFLLRNHVGNQHIASQRAEVTGSDGIVHRVLADYWFVSEQGDHERLLSTPRWISLVT